ncbi:hypothetical protein GCM10027514_06480 [Azotobacter armeniacus]
MELQHFAGNVGGAPLLVASNIHRAADEAANREALNAPRAIHSHTNADAAKHGAFRAFWVSHTTPEKAGHAGFFWPAHFTRRKQKG